MRVQLCGRLEVEGPDGPVGDDVFGGRRSRTAFAYLLVERTHAVEREVLAEILWPDGLPNTWESALRSALSRVRLVCEDAGLGREVIVTRGGTVHLVVDDTLIDVDIELARSAVHDAEAALLRGEPAEARNHAELSVEVLDKPFLPGHGGEWIEQQRRELHQVRLRARDALATAAAALGDLEAVIAVTEGTIDLEPFHEAAHRALMAAHASMGNRAEALRAYTRCRSILAEELGIDPSPETEQVYLDLLLLDGPPRARMEATPRGALPAPLRARDDLPLAGRGIELESLRMWWKRLTEDSRSVALITGEAGIGKSRLARELAAIAHSDEVLVLYGRCDAAERIPFQPFVEALQDHAAAELDFLRPTEARASGPQHERVDTALDDHDRDDAFDTLGLWLARLATKQPVLFVLDDIQWAGDDTLLMLRRVIRRAAGVPVGIMLTCRGVDSGEGALLADLVAELVRDDRLLRIDLQTLDQHAVGAILSGVGGVDLDADGQRVATELHEHTDGNPFFVGETLRHRMRTGELHLDDQGHWTTRTGVASIAPGVREVVLARVRDLGPAAIETLTVAAVIGPDFDLALLGDCVDGGLAAAVDVVDAAMNARLARSEPEHPGRARFVHAVVRSSLLESTTEPRRLMLHQRVGQALEALPDHAGRSAALAEHFAVAAALGDSAPAARYAVDAAAEARNALAYETAAAILRRALDLRLAPHDRASLLIELATVDLRVSDSEEAHEAYLEAIELARELADATLMARAALGAISGWRGGSDWFPDTTLRRLVLDALAMLPSDQAELRVRLLGELSLWTLEPGERHALGRRAMALVPDGSPPALVVAGFGASRVAWWGPEQSADRLAYADEVLSIAARRHDAHLWADVQLSRLSDLVQLGDRSGYEEARAALAESAGVRVSRRLRWQLSLFDVMDAMVSGQIDDGHRLAGEALAALGDEPHVDAIQSFGMESAAFHYIDGRADLAFELVELAAATLPDVLGFRVAVAWGLAALGRADEARSLVQEIVVDDFQGVPRDNGFSVTVHLLTEALVNLEDEQHARALYELALGMSGQLVVQPGPCIFLGPADASLGALAALFGDLERAAQHFDRGVAAAQAFGAPFWVDRVEAIRAQLVGT